MAWGEVDGPWLEELMPVEPVVTAWLSGSRVEGLAHASSDIDFYCAVESLDEVFPWTRRDPGRGVWVTIEDGHRIDFEYWTLEELGRIAAKLDAIPFDDPDTNLLDHLSSVETEMVHRIKVGVPVVARSAFTELRERFDFDSFRRYMMRNASYYLDDAFDDTVGMYQEGDFESAALRARATLGFSVDALLAAYDVTNDKPKFRLEKLRSLTTRRPDLRRYWETYREAVLAIPLDTAGQARYVERALELSSELMERAQRRPEPDALRSSIDVEARPARRFSVRKRRSGGETYLVHQSDIYSIDRFGEALWDLADGSRSLLDILALLVDRFPDCERVEALERTIRIVTSFRDLGLLALDPGR